MKIVVRKNSAYKEILIEDGNATIKTGLLDKFEREEIIEEFQNAIDTLREE